MSTLTGYTLKERTEEIQSLFRDEAIATDPEWSSPKLSFDSWVQENERFLLADAAKENESREVETVLSEQLRKLHQTISMGK